MNFKARAIGIIAGTAVALGITSGVLAAGDNATVTLQDNNSGDCSISLHGTFELGTWTWNGSSYSPPVSGAATLNASITQTISSSDVQCYVTAQQAKPLTNNGNTINMSFSINNGTSNTITPVTTSSGSGANVPVEVWMSTLADQPSGTYTGEVTVTVSKTSN